jgi:hypothetical protein
MLSTVDLLIKVACFVNKVRNIFTMKGANINWLVQGGQLYRAFLFSKTSLVIYSGASSKCSTLRGPMQMFDEAKKYLPLTNTLAYSHRRKKNIYNIDKFLRQKLGHF